MVFSWNPAISSLPRTVPAPTIFRWALLRRRRHGEADPLRRGNGTKGLGWAKEIFGAVSQVDFLAPGRKRTNIIIFGAKSLD